MRKPRPKPRHCRPVPWAALRKEIHTLKLKVAAVAIRGVTTLHELRALAKEFQAHQPEGRLELSIGLVKLKTPKGNGECMATTIDLSNEQEVDVTLTPKTAKGKIAKIDGVPTWTIQSGTSAEVIPAADGKSATLRTVDDGDGDTVILAEADADLGAGFEPLDETITLRVSTPKAASLGVTVGDPRDKTEAAPAGDGPIESPTARAKAKSKKR